MIGQASRLELSLLLGATRDAVTMLREEEEMRREVARQVREEREGGEVCVIVNVYVCSLVRLETTIVCTQISYSNTHNNSYMYVALYNCNTLLIVCLCLSIIRV